MAVTKMARRSPAADRARPHEAYKDELFARIMALEPRSVLDVGCGDGALLARLHAAGCPQVFGLEPEAESAALARAGGVDVRDGRAERLPFPDRGVEVVVLDYVAHHVERLDQALLEAARVAARAVIVLDGWYEPDLPSQRAAAAFDGWLKRIDRRGGMVHNPCPTAADLVRPFLALPDFEIDLTHRLRLQPLDLAAVEARAEVQMGAGGVEHDRVRLDPVLDEARRHGVTDDGAVLLVARRSPA